MSTPGSTERLHLIDATVLSFDAVVMAVDPERSAVALDRTAFYATGGGQPHDTGSIRWPGGSAEVTDVRSVEGLVWHTVHGNLPATGSPVTGLVDSERRHHLMRTHTAMHLLCGVIWNEWGVLVTGGNMEPLSARMDFEFDPLPEHFSERITELVNAEIHADREVLVSFLPRALALSDNDLIRTKVNLIPETVTDIRVVDIVGLDKQADGGTHVARTGEVGRFEVVKTESKGKGNKRVRIVLHDR